jgi:hypothetical protein
MKRETDRLRSRQAVPFEVMARQTNPDVAPARCRNSGATVKSDSAISIRDRLWQC